MAEETPPPGGPTPDPFDEWYRNTIQAHPETYDPAHFSEGQARAWFPLWSGHGFRSSKVDAQGNPIAGDSFAHPDECPPGTTAYGANACVPLGSRPGTGPGGGGGGAPGGGQGGDGGYGRFRSKPYGGPTSPTFNWPTLPKFEAPTGANEMNDPGYQFRLKQGEGALEASAAARGTLNTGGTLQDILKYGQNYASQEFGNVWNRAKDQYAPLLAEWQQRTNAEQQRGQSEFQRAWDEYQFMLNDEFRREQLIANVNQPY